MPGTTETEVKLDAGTGFQLPAFDDLGDGVEAVALPEVRMTATYVDTPGLRLVRSGVTLRHRAERDAAGGEVSEWTVKLPLPSRGGAVVRRELRWPGSDDELPPDADALVRPWRRLEALGPVARLVQVRSRLQLVAAGTPVLEVDDDVVSVMQGARLEARFRQVEVEVLDPAGEDLLDAVVGRLEAAGAHRGDDRSKLERALGGRAAAPPDVAPVRVRRSTPAAEAATAEVADAYVEMARAHVATLLGDDGADAARAALRRLSALTGEALPAVSALDALVAAERVADIVGSAAAALPDPDRASAAELVERLEADAAARRAAVRVELTGDAHAAAIDRIALTCSRPGDDGAADRSLPADLAAQHHRVDDAVKSGDPRAVAREAASLAALARAGRGAPKLTDAATDLAGAADDLAAARAGVAWLRREGPAASPEVALAAGQLLAAARHREAAAAEAFEKAARRLRRRR